MFLLIIFSVVIGFIVSGLTGFSVLGWVAGVVFFILALPGTLIGGFVDDKIRYAQDRADYRQMMTDINADMREAARVEKEVSTQIYNDNRSVHFYDRKRGRTKRSKALLVPYK